jgi:hypothetical protein
MTDTGAPVADGADGAAGDAEVFLGCVVCRRPLGPDGACGCRELTPGALTPAVHRHAAEAVLASLVHASEAPVIPLEHRQRVD